MLLSVRSDSATSQFSGGCVHNSIFHFHASGFTPDGDGVGWPASPCLSL